LREEEIPHCTNGHSEKRQLTDSSGRSLDDDKLNGTFVRLTQAGADLFA
jgi:hypothetical protein